MARLQAIRCWKKWEISITKAFINNAGSTKDHKPLVHPIVTVPYNPPTNMPWEIQQSVSMQEYVDMLPPFFKQIVGDITIPLDDGAHLAQILQSGQTIWAYTDGSVKDKIAAHSYLLICGDDWHDHQITGAGETTGDPSTICSLRPEHSGALAAMIIIAIIESKYKLNKSKGYLNIGIDNITVVKQLKKDKIDDLDDVSHDPTDYDLWQER